MADGKEFFNGTTRLWIHGTLFTGPESAANWPAV